MHLFAHQQPLVEPIATGTSRRLSVLDWRQLNAEKWICAPSVCSKDESSLQLQNIGTVMRIRLSTGCSGGTLATTHHSFLSSFSAISKRNFATKYAFCSNFQNLQNYLADLLKRLQRLQKIAKFPDFCEKDADFCENL
jgi:hypothetical protein